MNNNIYRVLATQFLTAFADNAVLFTAITMVLNQSNPAEWYIPALQASFLVAFVMLAPWVGQFADARPKSHVLFGANIIKATGVGLLFLQVEPLIAYAVVGLGAATYSPAKYGILPELTDEESLVKANGWVEGSTIVAILSGTVVGAILAEYSISIALFSIIVLYMTSAMIALFIKHSTITNAKAANALPKFFKQMRSLISTPRARYSLLGASLFWAAANVLRILLIAWAPVVLLLDATSDIAMLTVFIAIGIAFGSILVPRLIPIEHLRRTRLASYAMGLVVFGLSTVDNIWGVRIALFLAGTCGGLFVVPINAALQEIGHKTIGSGGAVAIQNFFQNFAMLIASGIYALLAGMSISPITIMQWLGLIVVLATIMISRHLPDDEDQATNE